ncbi:iron transporter [Paracoccus suum]|uniref:Iron transporter n=1 Tax=Paracoccus suum TaxID=2259340 RepID=A0A344PMR9_9RHOB|nr:iron uptake transporter permease EfeU [Paracoccus suum]AXC50674.1 iron transporter [Paracoccus suum]
MLAPFLIMLREGLEAALIVGIIASYLHRTGRRAWLPVIWIGVLLAIALSLFAGAALLTLSGEFPQKAQEAFEAVVGLIAVGVLTWMVFWMRRASVSMRDGLQGGVDRALAAPTGATWALLGMAFFATAREGLESVFFLLAIFQQSPGPMMPLAALAGVAVSILVGLLIYRGGVRINLRLFFRWTGILILFVAAGLLASVMRNLHEAGVWNHLQLVVVDLSAMLPTSSVFGTVLAGILGYDDTPTVGEVLVWAAYLAVTLPLYLRPSNLRPPAMARPLPVEARS